ncbi:hypothetical protein [Lysobacter niastensis]|uniref:Uncharacterized protein n=1 Tax=Lysobacter niastensis TaxID=380629 RepID=A0ABS0B405_9GAMM|nr:hypothetical protein [Lysobacter niastensis]MBF6023246.1 hypothetical protein [Lysobacter niastensis]
MAAVGTAHAGEGYAVAANPALRVSITPASPAERGALIHQFVTKWGSYVEQIYGLDAGVWSQRLVPQFAHGDSANLRRAVRRDTFEGAMAELSGRGQQLTDDAAITMLAKASMVPLTVQTSNVMPMALGDAEGDLVYTPLQPCRIADTRNVAAGPIAANASRNFVAWGMQSYAAQGGSPTDCGLATASPAAVVVNLTTVTPQGAGYATVYPYGESRPNASSLNYKTGDIVGNSMIAKLAAGTPSFDFTLYSYAQADYVVDIVGYFDAPKATPLECTDISQVVNIAAGERGYAALTCPTGYTATGGGVRSPDNANQVLQASGPNQPDGNEWFSSVLNSGASAKDFTFSARCCRVPGR